ncbi:hypothetical protein GCM10022222_17160 [Amycolatopsis ultiminotia]|uniref:Secreted protein n=2 Tax=Amycolatopsis ultiminotia TaxID=543629 RepID=A0ABP6VJE4_9PSEU
MARTFLRSVFGAGLVVGALAIAGTSGVADAAPAVDRPLQVCNNGTGYSAQAIPAQGESTRAIFSGCTQINVPEGTTFLVRITSAGGRKKELANGGGLEVYRGWGTQAVICGDFDNASLTPWRYGGDPRC